MQKRRILSILLILIFLFVNSAFSKKIKDKDADNPYKQLELFTKVLTIVKKD